MNTRLKCSIVTALLVSSTIFILAFLKIKVLLAFVIGGFSFVFFFIMSYFRIFRSIKTDKFIYNLKDSKEVIYTMIVNYYDDIYYSRGLFVNRKINASMGGRLYLLEDRLIFQTNLLNIASKREVIIFIKDIYCISLDSRSFCDKSLAIETDTEKYEFVSKHREEWKTQILRQKAALLQDENSL